MRSESLLSDTTVLEGLGKLTCLVIGARWLLAQSLARWEVAALEEACSASHSTSASVSCRRHKSMPQGGNHNIRMILRMWREHMHIDSGPGVMRMMTALFWL